MSVKTGSVDRALADILRAKGITKVDDSEALRELTRRLTQYGTRLADQLDSIPALRTFVRQVWDLAFTESRPPKTMDDLRDYLKRTMEADDFLIFDVCGVCDGEAVISKDPARRDDPDAPTIPCSACVRGRFPL